MILLSSSCPHPCIDSVRDGNTIRIPLDVPLVESFNSAKDFMLQVLYLLCEILFARGMHKQKK